MTRSSSFKRRVRERMSKTGESYTAARARLVRPQAPRPAAAPVAGRPPDAKVVAATGKAWAAWFAILDRRGATKLGHREIAAWLGKEQGVPAWWSQTITVWYERGRGMRLKHQQKDGFSVSVTRTIAAPARALFEAFVDPRLRRAWLEEPALTLRTKLPARSGRFDVGGGPTRLLVTFVAKGDAKTLVAISHERLPDPRASEAAKASWKERLAALKRHAEG